MSNNETTPQTPEQSRKDRFWEGVPGSVDPVLEYSQDLYGNLGWMESYEAVDLALGLGGTIRRKVIRNRIFQNSRQDRIAKDCPDDMNRRFKDVRSMWEWGAEHPTQIYSFSHVNDLASIVGFRKKEMMFSEFDFTMLFRVYDGYRGKGNAQAYLELTHLDLLNDPDFSPVRGIWITVNKRNRPAVSAYSRFGYDFAEKQPFDDRLLMEYHV